MVGFGVIGLPGRPGASGRAARTSPPDRGTPEGAGRCGGEGTPCEAPLSGFPACGRIGVLRTVRTRFRITATGAVTIPTAAAAGSLKVPRRQRAPHRPPRDDRTEGLPPRDDGQEQTAAQRTDIGRSAGGQEVPAASRTEEQQAKPRIEGRRGDRPAATGGGTHRTARLRRPERTRRKAPCRSRRTGRRRDGSCSSDRRGFRVKDKRFRTNFPIAPAERKKERRAGDAYPPFVELPGLEPGITGPESVVLPLHHSSIPVVSPLGLTMQK